MPTGKPDFNLNSYGVKYLSKEEVQEFLNKRAGLNVSSSTQTTPEDVEEKKVMGKIKPKGKTPIKQAQPKVDKLGKKIPESVTQEGTSTTPSPSITPKEGVFDNVPQTEKDMVTQEGGSSHYKKQPKMPKKELGGKGRYAERVDMELSERKENPVLPKNASDIITEMNIMKLDLMKDSLDGKGNNKPDTTTWRNSFGNNPATEGSTTLDPQSTQGQSTHARRAYNKPAHLRGDKYDSEKPFTKNRLSERYNGKEKPATYQRTRTGDARVTHDDDKMRDEYGARKITARQRQENDENELEHWRKHGKAPPKKKQPKPLAAGVSPKDLGKSADEIIFKAISLKLNLMKKDDPCWEGYEAIGMKDKDGKQVPNCVPKGDKKKAEEEKKPLNKPMRDDGNKKFKVYVRDPSTGNIVTVRFGDPNMEIKRDSPERRSSFRARHKCSEQKDITSAAYWSCKMWEKTSSVSDNIGKSADETIFKAISLKLDLMNKKDDWDKNERENERRSRGGGGSPDYNKMPFGVKQDMLHEQAVGRSGKGLKGKKINPKKQTFGEDAEEYGKIYDRQNETLKSQAEEIIFKAISLKLDLMKDGSPVPSAPYGTTIQRLRDGKGSGTRRQAARASAEDAYKKDHPEEDEDDFVRN